MYPRQSFGSAKSPLRTGQSTLPEPLKAAVVEGAVVVGRNVVVCPIAAPVSESPPHPPTLLLAPMSM